MFRVIFLSFHINIGDAELFINLAHVLWLEKKYHEQTIQHMFL